MMMMMMMMIMMTWCVVALLLMSMEHATAFSLHKSHSTMPDWALVKPVATANIAKECEFHCYLESRCQHWIFLPTNQSCFLTSNYVNMKQSHYSNSKSNQESNVAVMPQQTVIVQGHKTEFKNHVDRLLEGPLATSKSSYVNFPRKFYKGCSYTISMWVWLYQTEPSFDKKLGRTKEFSVFSTRPSLPTFDDYEALLPAVMFNIGHKKGNYFFSSTKDEFQDYKGAWGDEVKYHEWTHVTIVFSPSSFTPYINGKQVREEVTMDTTTCPFVELVDMDSRSVEEKEDLLEDLGYVADNETDRYQYLPHNTIFDLSIAKKSSPLFGIFQEVDIFSGIELSSSLVELLYDSSRSRVGNSLPTLSRLVHNFKTRGGRYRHSSEVLSNEYAMVALYGGLPTGRIYGDVCVEGLDANPRNFNDNELEESIIWPLDNISEVGVSGGILFEATDPQLQFTSEADDTISHVEKNEIFVINFSLGSKIFPYSYTKGVDSLTNAKLFCVKFWDDISKAFDEVNMSGIDVDNCIAIVAELTLPQVQHALQFSTLTDHVADKHDDQIDGVNDGDISIGIDVPDDLVSNVDDNIEGNSETELITRIQHHLDNIETILKRDNSDITVHSLESELDLHVRGIEKLLLKSDDADLAARIEKKLLALDGLLLPQDGDGIDAKAIALEGSAKEFQQLLIHIETVFYSPDLDDESFYEELQVTIDDLRTTFYAVGDVNDIESFENHLEDLSNAFYSSDGSAIAVSDTHLDAFEAALDSLHGDIIDRETFRLRNREDIGLVGDDTIPAFVDANEESINTDTTADTVQDSHEEREPHLKSTLQSDTTPSKVLLSETTTAMDGNLDTDFNVYNKQIHDISKLNLTRDNSPIDIKQMKVFPDKVDTRTSLEKQFKALELKVVLETFLRGPFYRQEVTKQLYELSNNESSLAEDMTNSTAPTTTIMAEILSSVSYLLSKSPSQWMWHGKEFLKNVVGGVFARVNEVTLNFTSLILPSAVVVNSSNTSTVANVSAIDKAEVSDTIIYDLVRTGLNSEKVAAFIKSYPDEVNAKTAMLAVNKSLTSALQSIYESVLQTNDEEDFESITQSLALLDLDILIEGVLFQQELADKGLLDEEKDIFEEDRIVESLRLYDAAMQWVDGRNVLASRYSRGAKKTLENENLEGDVGEASESSLIYSMWLSDELELEHPLLASGGGMFQGCGMMGQPSRMALAYRHSGTTSPSFTMGVGSNDIVETVLSSREKDLSNGAAADILLNVEKLLSENGEGDDVSNQNDQIKNLESPVITMSMLEMTEQGAHNFLSKLSSVDEKFVAGLSLLGTTDVVAADAVENIFEGSLSQILDTDATSSADIFMDTSELSQPWDYQAETSGNDSDGEATCQAAAAYYFPVMQYVSSNFGTPESGVKHPEGIRLSDLGPISGSLTDIVMSLGTTVSNWLGVQMPGGENLPDIFSGVASGTGGGTSADGGAAAEASMEGWEGSSTNAYYEQEAAEGNAEAQVWLGVRHYWGSSGYASNSTIARQYFEKAARQNNGEALYCLGALYENGQGGLVRNVTKAMELFTRAANLPKPHPTALQVLGTYHHRGAMKDRNLTLAKYYYEKSAELGDSAGYFSLGNLYREGYGRTNINVTKSNIVEQNIPLALHFLAIAAGVGHTRAISTLAHAFSDSESWLGHYDREFQQSKFKKSTSNKTTTSSSVDTDDNVDVNISVSTANDADLESIDLASRWGFNATVGVQLTLPNGVFVKFPSPYRPSCAVALPLLKYLSEFSYRPNDLTTQALEQFMVQDYAGALKLFDEAAELGVELAQLNSAFLYKYLLSSPHILPRVCRQLIKSHDNRKHCRVHFQNKLEQRLVQLAHMSNPEGFRELGDYLMLTANPQTDGAVTDASHLAIVVPNNNQQIALAGKMYAVSALKFKDIASLMSLADMVLAGTIDGIPKNTTLAKELYLTALDWERGSKSRRKNKSPTGDSLPRVHTYNDQGVTTGGLAPAVALAGIYLEEVIVFFKYLFH